MARVNLMENREISTTLEWVKHRPLCLGTVSRVVSDNDILRTIAVEYLNLEITTDKLFTM